MAFNAFVNFGDIKGECTEKDHKDWVVITQFSQEIQQPPSKTARTGAAGEVPAFTITKHVDAATPLLYEAACKGTHIPEVTIECWRGGNPLKYYEIKLKEVTIGSVVTNGDSGSTQSVPVETVSLTYGAIQWTYTKQKPDGTAGGNITTRWSRTQAAQA